MVEAVAHITLRRGKCPINDPNASEQSPTDMTQKCLKCLTMNHLAPINLVATEAGWRGCGAIWRTQSQQNQYWTPTSQQASFLNEIAF
jgi:hypothetical protein